MATYECAKCGMSVNATCGKCNDPLVDDTIDVTIPIPAEGPSFGVAPSGTCI